MARYPIPLERRLHQDPSGAPARWAPRSAEQERTPGTLPRGMALWYRYPAALRWGTAVRHGPIAGAPRTGPSACVSSDRARSPDPAAAAAERPRHARPRRVRRPGRAPTSSASSATSTPAAIALRPHVKTHKSVRIARMQLDAGAAGLTVGTLGEAEVLASAGLRDLFLAYPLWAEGAEGVAAARRPRVGRPGGRRRLRRGRRAAGRGGGRRPAAAAGAGRGGLGRPPDRRRVAGARRSRSRARRPRPGSSSRACSPTAGTATGRRRPARPGSTRSPRSRPRPPRWRPPGSRCAP